MTVPFQPVNLFTKTPLADAVQALATTPPALTRLEPQSVSGDPRPGAEAVVADPLWMLGRQWQLGELQGEDVGTPVAVHVRRQALPVTAWAPFVDGETPQWRPWPQGALLDELVEDVPRPAAERGLRWRAETGQQLLDLLHEAGLDEQADALLAAHPLTLDADPADPDGSLDPAADRLLSALAGAVPDGAAARDALESGRPSWASGAAEVADAWLSWVTGAAQSGGAWSTPRLEHAFLLRFGSGRDDVVLRATAFGSGTARWHHFTWLPDQAVRLGGAREGTAQVTESDDVLLATALRYPGMPADRYWQLEDGTVDVSVIEAQPHDLARLCLAEFALVTGDDWLAVPLDAELGALNQVLEVAVTTTFGERFVVPEAAEDRHTGGFRMFEVLAEDGRVLQGVVLPPAAVTPLVGDPVEEVAFVRDETANLAWAIERVVPGRSGDPRSRADEPRPLRQAPPADLRDGDLAYELQAPVPRHWVPLVPVVNKGEISLRKGAMSDGTSEILAASSLLAPTPLDFPEEEIPREGITVRAVPVLARRRDGSYARWTAHRTSVGRGEASSGLAYDSARPVRRQVP